MNAAQRALVLRLATVPGQGDPMPAEEFLRQFRADDGVMLGVDLLTDAVRRRDRVDIELALIVGFRFGWCQEHLPLLVALSGAEWHTSHEDVASALGQLKSAESIPALVRLAQWVPPYLEFDSARALSSKALWALGGIQGDAAARALAALAESDDAAVANRAKAQIERRAQPAGS